MSFVYVGTMPVLQFFCNFRIYISIFIKEITPFIKIDDNMEQMVDT